MRGEWSIQELAQAAGTTSRTLRHYGDVGVLEPSRTGANGYRYYDERSLVRLQRILLLRDLGLSLATIADVLRGEQDPAAALRTHLDLLRQEQDRIARQIASVTTTLRKTEGRHPLMPEEMFDGFDHTRYKDEVIERWGRESYESGDRWWRSMSDEDKRAFQQTVVDIARDFGDARSAGLAPDSEEVQAIAARQYEWVGIGWQGRPVSAEAFAGLGQMYVDDPRFGANYDVHGKGTAEFVRDAMRVFADSRLS